MVRSRPERHAARRDGGHALRSTARDHDALEELVVWRATVGAYVIFGVGVTVCAIVGGWLIARWAGWLP